MRPLTGLTNRAASRPRVTLFIAVAMVGGLAVGIAGIQVCSTTSRLLPNGHRAAEALRDQSENFATGDQLLVLLRTSDDDGSDPERGSAELFAYAERLKAAVRNDLDLRAQIRDIHEGPSPKALRFSQAFVTPRALHYLSDDAFRQFLRRLDQEEMVKAFEQNRAMLAAPGPAAAILANRLIKDPLRLREFLDDATALPARPFATREGSDRLLARDGRSLLVQIEGVRPARDLAFSEKLVASVNRAIDNAKPGKLRVDLTGGYAIADHTATTTRSDMVRAVNGSVLLLAILFLVVFRSLRLLLWLLLPTVMALLATFGVLGLLGGHLTPLTAVVGGIIAGLGVDYAVHWVSHYRQQAGNDDPIGAVSDTTRRIALPVVGACGTTAVAFGAIAFSSIPAVREFSLLGIFGLALALLATLTVLPATIVSTKRSSSLPKPRVNVDRIMNTVIARPGRTLIIAGMVTALSLVAAVMVGGPRFAGDLTSLHPRPHPPLETQKTIAATYETTPHVLSVHVAGNDPLKNARRVHAALLKLPLESLGLGLPIGLPNLVPKGRTQALAELDVRDIFGRFRIAAEQTGFEPDAFPEFERFLTDLLRAPSPTLVQLEQYPEVMRPFVPCDGPITRTRIILPITRLWSSIDERHQLLTTVRRSLKDTPAVLTGVDAVSDDVFHRLRGELLRLLLVAGLGVLIWLLICLRHPARVGLAMVPAGIGLLAIVLIMGLGDIGFDPVTLMAVPLALGLGVDDGIFLTALAKRNRDRGADRDELTKELAVSGLAITLTSWSTAMAFGSLLFTHTPAIRHLGLLTAVGVLAAWLAALGVVIPAIAVGGKSR